jgi:DNA-binding response OmpR family regulator
MATSASNPPSAITEELGVDRILVVDDDREFCELISGYLVRESFQVECVYNGKHGLERTLSGKYDVVALDLVMPGMSGTQMLQQIRETSLVGVIILTAYGEEIDRILSLEYGADDYLAKPFNPRELVARIRTLLRRLRPSVWGETTWTPEHLEVGDIQLDRRSRSCCLRDAVVELTSTEFELLYTLMRSSGRPVSRKDLMRTVMERDFSPFDRSIDVHLSNIRKKLGPTSDGLERIRSVRNYGYIYLHSIDKAAPAAEPDRAAGVGNSSPGNNATGTRFSRNLAI